MFYPPPIAPMFSLDWVVDSKAPLLTLLPIRRPSTPVSLAIGHKYLHQDLEQPWAPVIRYLRLTLVLLPQVLYNHLSLIKNPRDGLISVFFG